MTPDIDPRYAQIMEKSERYRKQMRRYEKVDQARFLTFSTYQRLPLFDNRSIRDLFCVHLENSRRRDRFRLLAWVIMPEHLHLLFWPRDRPISRTLISLKSGFAREVIDRWRTIEAPVLIRIADDQGRHRFWQRGGGYDRNIRDEDELREKIAYIHGNPVKRGLVERPCEWVWSSARWYDGERSGPVQIDPWAI